MTTGAADPWSLIHAERARLVDVLEDLKGAEWQAATLCTKWNVEQVTAHVTAAATTGFSAWLGSMALAGFNSARHNDRRLSRQLGPTPRATLSRFTASVGSTVAPTKDYPAWLGEVIVHGQDIARPLRIDLRPDPIAVAEVARFYAAKDFAVNSRSMIAGLSLRADDAAFAVGDGPVVRGPLLDLVMAMAGRTMVSSELHGDGADELHQRLA